MPTLKLPRVLPTAALTVVASARLAVCPAWPVYLLCVSISSLFPARRIPRKKRVHAISCMVLVLIVFTRSRFSAFNHLCTYFEVYSEATNSPRGKHHTALDTKGHRHCFASLNQLYWYALCHDTSGEKYTYTGNTMYQVYGYSTWHDAAVHELFCFVPVLVLHVRSRVVGLLVTTG